jgi:hypothetical protein
MPNTLNDIFAHLDNAKASRAYETNHGGVRWKKPSASAR